MTTHAPVVIDLRDAPAPARRRIPAIDAARGLAMVVMLLAVHPGPRDGLWQQLVHPEWHGVRLADLAFPLFLFAVGASMTTSTSATTWGRVLRRAAILFALGLVLQLVRHGEVVPQGVLQHIAIAYVAASAVLRAPRRWQLPICAAVLAAAWLAHVVFADGGDPWSPDGGFAHVVNGWFFGDFVTEGVPQSLVSVVNVAAGAWAVRRRDRLWRPAVALVAAGLALSTVVPLNKHLWTPSYALLTAGTSIAIFLVLRVRSPKPLVVLGMNAIAVYAVFIGVLGALARHRGWLDELLSPLPGAVVANGWAIAWLLGGWALAAVLYRRRLFLKI